ncbi:glucosaminidase domain-containing protein [Macellibacteroides fermentans]|uniref:glucosaminidase domain-containing protein n=1 Tax=Macellibacteroides fermentans TaxID=879969 RepID=UPI00406D23D2
MARGRPGINAFAVTVQSSIETGHWKSYLWINTYNGAGIKAQASWRSAGHPYIRVSSPESADGKYIRRESYFRSYSSPEEFIQDYRLKILRDYPHSAANADNMWGYFAGLYGGRIGYWATDHKYFQKLTYKAIQLAPELLGPGWQKRLNSAYTLALTRKSLFEWQKNIIQNALKEVDAK